MSYSAWAYHRLALSARDIEDLLAERGIILSYKSIGRWCLNFGCSSGVTVIVIAWGMTESSDVQ